MGQGAGGEDEWGGVDGCGEGVEAGCPLGCVGEGLRGRAAGERVPGVVGGCFEVPVEEVGGEGRGGHYGG